MTAVAALFIAVFLACLVEAVEATTIVVAMGATRSWRSALLGTGGALVVLAVTVAIFGPVIMLLPLNVLRLVVGGLLLVFGLQWLRKAVLRSSGLKSLHDEAAIYRKEVTSAQSAREERRFGVDDWYAFTVSFKGAFLEGLEVVFIVLTFATNQGNLPVAVIAAGVAIVVVVITGAIVRGPLSRVPENTLKFIVGIMLASFGAFWGAEGAGARWPGSDVALLVIIPALAAYCGFLIGVFAWRRRIVSRRPTQQISGTAVQADAPTPRRPRGRLARFGMFWYDFIVGDDWQIFIGVVIALGTVAVAQTWMAAWLIPCLALLLLIPYGTGRAARGQRPAPTAAAARPVSPGGAVT